MKHWDLETEKAIHNKYVYDPNPLRFANKKPGKMTTTDPKKLKRLKVFKKYKLKNRPAAVNRVVIIGPKWNRSFLIRRAGIQRKRIKRRGRILKNMKRLKEVSKSDKRRFKKMIPYYKQQKFFRIRNRGFKDFN